MVKIPRGQSTGNLTTETTAPRINDPSSFTRVAEATGKAGEALFQVSQKFKRLEDLSARTNAIIGFNNDLNSLTKDYGNRADLKGSDATSFDTEARKIRQKYMGDIPNPDDRASFMISSNTAVNSSTGIIRKKGFDLDIIRQDEYLTTVTQQQHDRVLEADVDSPEFGLIVADATKVVANEIDTTVAIGGSSHGKRVQRIDDFTNTLGLDKANHDIKGARTNGTARDKISALKGIQARLEHGTYGLDNAQTTTTMGYVSNFISKFEVEEKFEIAGAQTANAVALHDRINDDKNPTGVDEILEAVSKENLDPYNGIKAEEGTKMLKIINNIDLVHKGNRTVKEDVTANMEKMALIDMFTRLNLADNKVSIVTEDGKKNTQTLGEWNDGNIFQIQEFREAVTSAEANLSITHDEAIKYMTDTSELYERRNEEEAAEIAAIGKAGWREYKRWLLPNVVGDDTIGEGKFFGGLKFTFEEEEDHTKLTDESQAARNAQILAIKTDLSARLASKLMKIKTEAEARRLVDEAKKEFIIRIKPEAMKVPGGVPNSMVTAAGTENVYDGTSDSVVDKKGKEPDYTIEYDPVTGVKARVFKDRSVQIIGF